MTSDWLLSKLGKVLDPIKELAGVTGIEEVLSVTEKRGIIPQTEVFHKRIAIKDVAKYKVLRHLDIAYNPYLLWTGAVGQWLGQQPGVTSPVYECFRARPGVSPRYIGLVLESGLLTPYFDSTAIGSIERRRRTTQQVFLDAEFNLPPLPLQRRIVDLMAHVDSHLATLGDERDAAADLLTSMLEAWDEALEGEPTVTVGSICSPRSGPSWAAAEESRELSPGSVRVMKITNTRPDGTVDMTEHTYVVGLTRSVSRLSDRSLILIRTNGNRNRIGNVYRATSETYGCAVSAFQFSAELPTVIDRDWMYWWLRVPTRQQAMSDAASGTTGLGNLASGWLKLLDVPWPEPSLRASSVQPLEAVAEQVRRLDDEVAGLSAVRSCLLHDLLSGAATISETYNVLRNGVA